MEVTLWYVFYFETLFHLQIAEWTSAAFKDENDKKKPIKYID